MTQQIFSSPKAFLAGHIGNMSKRKDAGIGEICTSKPTWFDSRSAELKRIVAFIIDWILSGIPAIIYACIFGEISKTDGLNAVNAALFILFFLSYPALFVLRDVIFKGRSIAKRILGLRVIDAQTNASPSKSKLIIRNLFFFIYPIEAILLLANNRMLGDTATGTTVITKQKN